MYKRPKVLAEALLGGCIGFLVRGAVKACGGDLGGEPVGFREVKSQRDKVFFNLAFGQLLADLVERFDRL